MTDSPEFILARIAEIQTQLQLNDLSIRIFAAMATVSLFLFVALIVADRMKGGFGFDLVFLAGGILSSVSIITTLLCGFKVYDNFALQIELDQLTSLYEAVYGPLPVRW